MAAQNYAYLIQVNALANNNKYYEITENQNGSLDVRYGRVGGREMQHHYSPYEKSFYGLKEEKERKGYEDRTALHSEIHRDNTSAAEAVSFKPLEDQEVQDLFDLLISSSREFMQKNYTVSSSEITEKMVKEAERDIAELNSIAGNQHGQIALYNFNQKLQELFTDIPRKMKKVEDNLAQTENDFTKIIQKEIDMLDNIKGIILNTKSQAIDKKTQKKSETVLQANGIDVRPVTYKEEDTLMEHLGFDYDGRNIENRFVKAFAVENNKTRQAYEDYKQKHNMTDKDVRLFYHGSKVENWYAIVKQGLLLNPKAVTTGKMFGQGLYFAPELRKSLNYMDVLGSHWNSGSRQTGYCAVYAVALGKCYEPNHVIGSCFNEKDLPRGTHSLFAGKNNPNLGLRNDEYVVYNQSACTIKYLIEMSKQQVRSKDYNLDRKKLKNKIQDEFSALVKTANGVSAELDINALSGTVLQELEKITANKDFETLKFYYNSKTDKLENIVGIKNNTEVALYPSLTNDDYAFLSREFKKAFAKSENEWKDIVKKAETLDRQAVVIDKGSKETVFSEQQESKTPELFGVTEGIICQQCNCKGAYGAGLSGAISDKFPSVYKAFKDFNEEYPDSKMQLGKHQIISLSEEKDLKGHGLLAVANLYTQENYGNGYRTGIKYTDTDKLVSNIEQIAKAYPEIPVYVPHSVDHKGRDNGIGCGLAGEKWANLYPRLKALKLPNLYLLDTHSCERTKVNEDLEMKKNKFEKGIEKND